MKKLLKVAILFGGRSCEHEVSILSARSILQNIDRTLYQAMPVYIDKQGVWHTDSQKIGPLLTCPEESLLAQRYDPTKSITQHVRKLAFFDERKFDLVFPVLHGLLGEDGTIQGLLEVLDLPYVGSDVLGSAIGMDKAVAKRLIVEAKLPTTPYLALNEAQWIGDPTYWIKQIDKMLAWPVFVKPVRSGSSLGINKAKNKEQLKQYITEAFTYDQKIIVEKAIQCREIELAVLENLSSTQAPMVSLPGEIVPTHEFYSYEAKYVDQNGARLIVPAELNQAQIEEAQSLAQRAFVALACQGMARVDLFWDRDSQCFLFNEVNTIPGFTKISMYPKVMAQIGMDYRQLITHLLQLAMIRYQQRQKHQ